MADGERFERCAETTLHPASPPCHRSNFSHLLRIEGHNAIRIAPLPTSQRNGLGLDQRHGGYTRDWRDGLIWFVLFIWFIWLVLFTYKNQTNEINQITAFLCLRTFSA